MREHTIIRGIGPAEQKRGHRRVASARAQLRRNAPTDAAPLGRVVPGGTRVDVVIGGELKTVPRELVDLLGATGTDGGRLPYRD